MSVTCRVAQVSARLTAHPAIVFALVRCIIVAVSQSNVPPLGTALGVFYNVTVRFRVAGVVPK